MCCFILEIILSDNSTFSFSQSSSNINGTTETLPGPGSPLSGKEMQAPGHRRMFNVCELRLTCAVIPFTADRYLVI